MSRRVAPALFAALVTLGLTGCTTQPRPAARPVVPAEPSPASTPSPRVPAGSAPERAFAVGVRQLTVTRDERRLPTTVWYPAVGRAGGEPERSADAARGAFPVIMFSHGLGGRPADYETLLSRWAAAGFVVAAPTFPRTSSGGDGNVLDVLNQPADVSSALTQVLALDAKAGDPLRGRLAVDRVAAAGHSAGGVTTIGLFTTGRDERLDAGVVFAGTALGVGTAFAGAAAPQLFVHGQADEVVDYAAGRAAYDRVPWPKAMLSLPKGDHGRALLTDGPALRLVSDTTVEFLRWSLYGDESAKSRIQPDPTKNPIAVLDNRL